MTKVGTRRGKSAKTEKSRRTRPRWGMAAAGPPPWPSGGSEDAAATVAAPAANCPPPSQPRSANLASALALLQYTLSERHCSCLDRYRPPSHLPAVMSITHIASQSRAYLLLLASGDQARSLATRGTLHNVIHPRQNKLPTTTSAGSLYHSPAIRLPSVTLTGNHFRYYLPHLLDLALPMCNY